jgi:hypothetical protein
MMLRITPATVARQPDHRGDHEGNRNTIAQRTSGDNQRSQPWSKMTQAGIITLE